MTTITFSVTVLEFPRVGLEEVNMMMLGSTRCNKDINGESCVLTTNLNPSQLHAVTAGATFMKVRRSFFSFFHTINDYKRLQDLRRS